MSAVSHALQVMGIGLPVMFAVILLFMVVSKVLLVLLQDKESRNTNMQVQSEKKTVTVTSKDKDNKEIIAVIEAAIAAYIQSSSKSEL